MPAAKKEWSEVGQSPISVQQTIQPSQVVVTAPARTEVRNSNDLEHTDPGRHDRTYAELPIRGEQTPSAAILDQPIGVAGAGAKAQEGRLDVR
jgi:hypothetical protein